MFKVFFWSEVSDTGTHLVRSNYCFATDTVLQVQNNFQQKNFDYNKKSIIFVSFT